MIKSFIKKVEIWLDGDKYILLSKEAEANGRSVEEEILYRVSEFSCVEGAKEVTNCPVKPLALARGI